MSYATLFSISGILIIVIYLPILLFVIAKGKSQITRLFSLHLLAVIAWGITATALGIVKNPEIALKIWHLGNVGVIFIPVLFLQVVCLMLNEKNKVFLNFAYSQAIFFLGIALMEKMYQGTKLMFGSLHYEQGGPFYPLYFISWFLTILIAHLKLIQHYRISYPQQKRQIFALLLAIPIGFGGGAMNFLPGFGINIFPFGNFLVPAYGLILAHAILKHQLLDIDIVIKKSVIYSTSIALLSILYLLTVFVLEKFAQGLFGYRSLIISLCTAFGLGLIFVPLRHRIQRLVDRYFFKGTQEEIVRQNEQLRLEVAQSDKYKTLSTLATGIAHEVKNPLTAMKTFCEYLPRKLDDKEFLLKFSRLVGNEVERIDHLVHQLLNYGKPAPLSVRDINIHKLISDTVDVLNSHFIAQRIDVSKDFYRETKLHLRVDPNQIRQALLNVLLNAVEAMPHGGELHVTTNVEPEASGKGTFVIRVKDSGSGISPEDLKHIFDPFFSRKDNGTGLGLAIVQGIMEQHGGKIKIESKVGIGTTVKLEFPIAT